MEAAGHPISEKVVSNCPTAFWLLVEEAATGAGATTPLAVLGSAGAAAGREPVAAVGAVAPVEMAMAGAAAAAEHSTLAGPVAAVVAASLDSAQRGALGRFATAVAAPRCVRVWVAATVVTAEVVEAAEAATTAEEEAALAVVLIA
jgi:hypothetical protein